MCSYQLVENLQKHIEEKRFFTSPYVEINFQNFFQKSPATGDLSETSSTIDISSKNRPVSSELH